MSPAARQLRDGERSRDRRILFDARRLPPTLTVLITSTGRLARPGVRAFPLDVLDLEAATMMFRDRLSRAGLEQEPEAEIGRLHRVVGGNPLALEWIVGQMRGPTSRHASRAGKAGVQLPRILSRLERGDAPILKRVFSQSWERLGADERTVLAAISVFVRPALEECLVATTGVRANNFHDALEDLLARYLVKRLRIYEGPNSELGGRRYWKVRGDCGIFERRTLEQGHNINREIVRWTSEFARISDDAFQVLILRRLILRRLILRQQLLIRQPRYNMPAAVPTCPPSPFGLSIMVDSGGRPRFLTVPVGCSTLSHETHPSSLGFRDYEPVLEPGQI